MRTISITYWVLWLATLVVCLYQSIRAYRDSRDFFGLPLIACFMFGYFYVLQSFYVATQLTNLLQPWMFEFGQFMALVCLSALLAGWYYGRKRFGVVKQIDSKTSVKMSTLWWVGLTFSLIGLIGLYSFDPGQNSFQESSAYWYMLFFVGYPGLLMCLQAMARSSKQRTWFHLLSIAALIIVFMYPFILYARRGPLFPMVIILLYGYMFASGKRPKKFLTLGGLLLAGTAMLTFVVIRDYSDVGASWKNEKLQDLSYQTIVVDKAVSEGDNEFLYHCGITATSYELGLYQYGTGYLSLLTHWVPRYFWQDKPILGQGWYDHAGNNVRYLTGWDLTNGAAAGGVSESFEQLGFAAPLLWFFFGLMVAKLYSRARDSEDLRSQALFIGILAATHWMIAQGFSAAYVPMLAFIFVPLVGFQFAKIKRRPRMVEFAPTYAPR